MLDTVVCGGTFDNFHKGHERFLEYAFSLGKKVIIGITSDDYVKNSKFKIQNSELIESFETRQNSVLEFIKSKGVLNRVKTAKIEDLFGSTLSRDLQIDAIVVSKNTKNGADIINGKRKELGLNRLQVFITPQTFAQDKKLISSQRVRNGEIDRTGRPYINPLWIKKNLYLPHSLRTELSKPFGNLISRDKINKDSLVVSVGDITTKLLNELSIKQKISVIDFKVARKEKFYNLSDLSFSGNEEVIKVKNPPATLTPSLFRACQSAWVKEKAVVIVIDGEEDLAVLPLILTAPLNSIVYYGQPGKGVVRILVSEQNKKIAYGLVDRFEMLKPRQTR